MATTIELDDPTGIINSLQARVQQLEGQIEAQRNEHSQAIAEAVGSTIKRLRMHGVILLDLNDSDMPRHSELLLDAVINSAYEQAWKLDRAPLSIDIKEAVRKAANGGSSRW